VRRPGLEALSHDFIRTARAKSLNEHTVVIRHALRNALTPIASIVGLQFGGLLSGTFNIEVVFGYPGVGQLAVNARLMRGQIMSLNRREYVESARAIGASNGLILFRHLLPNALSPHRARIARRRGRDPGGGSAQLHRSRRTTADARVGCDVERGPDVTPRRMVDCNLPRPRDCDHRLGFQFAW
jgi:ABC-type antimicrobial peptide transport system permease subunit